MVLNSLNRKNLKNILRKFKEFKNLVILFVFSFIFYSVISIIDNLSMISRTIFESGIHYLPISLVNSLYLYGLNHHWHRVSITLATSFLLGLNFLMIKDNFAFEGLSTTPGAFIGLVFTGCPACTASILSLLGFSMGLSFLPFYGFEINFLAIIFLTFSVFYISSKESENKCSDKIVRD